MSETLALLTRANELLAQNDELLARSAALLAALAQPNDRKEQQPC